MTTGRDCSEGAAVTEVMSALHRHLVNSQVTEAGLCESCTGVKASLNCVEVMSVAIPKR